MVDVAVGVGVAVGVAPARCSRALARCAEGGGEDKYGELAMLEVDIVVHCEITSVISVYPTSGLSAPNSITLRFFQGF